MRPFICLPARLVCGLLTAAVGLTGSAFGQSSPAKQEPGLSVAFATLEAGKAADVVTLPNVWLYVPNGKSPTPFLPGGKFSAVWNGFVTAEKRANYNFQAELNGSFKFELNGQVVLDV